jgi:hypothetical protein
MSTGIGILHLVNVARASAVAVSEDEDSATFNSVATLGLLASALMVFWGYRLIIKGIGLSRTAAKSNGKVEMNLFNLNLLNAAPGVFFAALSCVGVVAALWQLAK